jgi:hypothetical protein
LGPVPLASDTTVDGFQDYHQVSGRAPAVAIDPADPTGSTIYIGGAQGGVWKSTNNVPATTANSVAWTPLTDDQATLPVGAIAVQPGNSNPAECGVGGDGWEADDSADSYFGLGILRSVDARSCAVRNWQAREARKARSGDFSSFIIISGVASLLLRSGGESTAVVVGKAHGPALTPSPYWDVGLTESCGASTRDSGREPVVRSPVHR